MVYTVALSKAKKTVELKTKENVTILVPGLYGTSAVGVCR